VPMHRIALVVPQADPTVVGGAENLWAGLIEHLNRTPGIRAEMVGLRSFEKTLPEILRTYAAFARLDLSGFDQVISTKYPAWAILHPNHTVYLQHTLRGLYDTYPESLGGAFGQAQDHVLAQALPATLLKSLKAASAKTWAFGQRQQAADDCFAEFRSIAAVADSLLAATQSYPNELSAFPGNFSRACVRLLDAMAFSVGRVNQFAAISATVASRTDYFPMHAQVRVLHHPSNTKVTQTTPDSTSTASPKPRDLIVTASRLEHPKRIDLLLRAYAQSQVSLPFWIIGSGPQEEELSALAKTIPGVVMKGRLSDQDLMKAYQRAVFVPFIPAQEDYGLITLEAFLAGAAVLTSTDAGGPTELVEHGKNGFIAKPTVESIAEGFRQLSADPEQTAQMGECGRQLAERITWPKLLGALIQPSPMPRKRILVLNTFSVEPVVSGGSLRMKGLYTALSDYADIHMLSLAAPNAAARIRTHNPRFIEEIIPAEIEFSKKERLLSRRLNASCGDLAALLYPETLNRYRNTLKCELAKADEVVFSHPYMFTLYESLIQEHPDLAQPFIYEAHNVESYLKQSIYPDAKAELHAIRAVEVRLIRNANAVIACSHQDLVAFEELAIAHGFAIKKPLVAENGLDLSDIEPISFLEREQAAQRRGKRIALFMGSDHGPNQQALQQIARVARDHAVSAAWDFVVLGSVVHSWEKNRELPDSPGLHLVGLVSDEEKRLWLSAATVGLNPINSGSGTNLKLAEYAAHGLPVLSTAFGARGGVWQPGTHYLEITQSLTESLNQDTFKAPDQIQAMTERALQLVHERLHWPVIAKNLAGSLWACESPPGSVAAKAA